LGIALETTCIPFRWVCCDTVALARGADRRLLLLRAIKRIVATIRVEQELVDQVPPDAPLSRALVEGLALWIAGRRSALSASPADGMPVHGARQEVLPMPLPVISSMTTHASRARPPSRLSGSATSVTPAASRHRQTRYYFLLAG
jgi:hypothetical protein